MLALPELVAITVYNIWALVFGLYSIVPPKEPTCHFHILCNTWQHICMQKLLLVLGGEQYSIKLLITIYFIQKMIVLAKNPDPVARNMENKFCYTVVHYSGKLTCA